MAWSISSASGPRHSPTIILSGRIRSVLTTKSRILTRPLPSILAGRASKQTRFSCDSFSSAESSTVIIRSSSGMNCDSTFSNVVLPEPVPPETSMFILFTTAASKNSAISFVILPNPIKSSVESFLSANFRMVMDAPLTASGGMMAFTREPSGNRASTMGLASSI